MIGRLVARLRGRRLARGVGGPGATANRRASRRPSRAGSSRAGRLVNPTAPSKYGLGHVDGVIDRPPLAVEVLEDRVVAGRRSSGCRSWAMTGVPPARPSVGSASLGPSSSLSDDAVAVDERPERAVVRPTNTRSRWRARGSSRWPRRTGSTIAVAELDLRAFVLVRDGDVASGWRDLVVTGRRRSARGRRSRRSTSRSRGSRPVGVWRTSGSNTQRRESGPQQSAPWGSTAGAGWHGSTGRAGCRAWPRRSRCRHRAASSP